MSILFLYQLVVVKLFNLRVPTKKEKRERERKRTTRDLTPFVIHIAFFFLFLGEGRQRCNYEFRVSRGAFKASAKVSAKITKRNTSSFRKQTSKAGSTGRRGLFSLILPVVFEFINNLSGYVRKYSSAGGRIVWSGVFQTRYSIRLGI